mgnify:CR=1 FL=1
MNFTEIKLTTNQKIILFLAIILMLYILYNTFYNKREYLSIEYVPQANINCRPRGCCGECPNDNLYNKIPLCPGIPQECMSVSCMPPKCDSNGRSNNSLREEQINTGNQQPDYKTDYKKDYIAQQIQNDPQALKNKYLNKSGSSSSYVSFYYISLILCCICCCACIIFIMKSTSTVIKATAPILLSPMSPTPFYVAPRIAPRIAPSITPRIAPSVTPRIAPSVTPRIAPSITPRIAPSVAPSVAPSITPRIAPGTRSSK